MKKIKLVGGSTGGNAGGDFRIDNDIVIEVGGQDKGFSQVAGQQDAFVAADDIESATIHKYEAGANGTTRGIAQQGECRPHSELRTTERVTE